MWGFFTDYNEEGEGGKPSFDKKKSFVANKIVFYNGRTFCMTCLVLFMKRKYKLLWAIWNKIRLNFCEICINKVWKTMLWCNTKITFVTKKKKKELNVALLTFPYFKEHLRTFMHFGNIDSNFYQVKWYTHCIDCPPFQVMYLVEFLGLLLLFFFTAKTCRNIEFIYGLTTETITRFHASAKFCCLNHQEWWTA